jgi:adenosylcobinamide kinase/adenosylcobinamide-phosphate guanylyltransferase
MKSTLIIGGARSGKSRYAQEMAERQSKPVLFVATAEAGDKEMKSRIEAHRKARPADWKTLEAPSNIGSLISRNLGEARFVIIDCVTMLVSNVLGQHTNWNNDKINPTATETAVLNEINGLVDCLRQSPADFVIVSNEIGLGLVPADPLSRLYRDLLGRANQLLAQQADDVIMMTAGIPLKIKPGL